MCGILCLCSRQTDPGFEKALTTLSHRGPDGQGIFVEGGVHLGHHRLAILDLSEQGAQPMFSADGRYVLVYNGEIYNHLDIRAELLAANHTFHSTSDTETLLTGFIAYGPAVLDKLNGIFAFAIYDREAQTLFVARDQLGVKPLYYYWDGEQFALASEIKAMMQLSHFRKEISTEAFADYLHFLWCPGEKTPFRYVKKLLPGSCMQVDCQDLQTAPESKRYYYLPFHGNYSPLSEGELTDQLEQYLLAAVQRQLLSDVPVGFFLSGGLDSSLLVAMAKKLYPEKQLQCFTIDTSTMDLAEEGFSSDLDYARKVAQHLDVSLEIVKAYSEYLPYFDKVIWHLDEPQADPAPVNVLKICERAREMGYKVLLSGAGGDDVFSGYRRHQALKLEFLFQLMPSWAARMLQRMLSYFMPRHPLSRRLSKFLDGAGRGAGARMVHYFSWLNMERIRNLFQPGQLSPGYDPDDTLADLLHRIPEERSLLNRLLFLELRSFLPDHNLNYTDKLSMAAGVEVRVPYLDLEVVEFSTRIPPRLKLKGSTTKYLLRKVAERYLPQDVIYRPKAGFGAPVRHWIRKDWGQLVREKLLEGSLSSKAIFNRQEIERLIKDNESGFIDASYSIWALLAIESWIRQFCGEDSR